jgi:hypothetical protein
MRIRSGLLEIAEADRGEMISEDAYGDVHGFERLLQSSGDRERAVATILRLVRMAAKQKHGANVRVRSWAFFKSAIADDRAGIRRRSK